MSLTFAMPSAPGGVLYYKRGFCQWWSCREQVGVRRLFTEYHPHDIYGHNLNSPFIRTALRPLQHRSQWWHHPHRPRLLSQLLPLINHPRRRRQGLLQAVRMLASCSLLAGLSFARFWLARWGWRSRFETGLVLDGQDRDT